jgi:hypothetical protein
MTAPDWRSESAYEHLKPLNAKGFAWEFLRRNINFQKDVEELERAQQHGTLTRTKRDAFAAKWGVRFRKGRRGQRPKCRPLDGPSVAEREHRDSRARLDC